MPALLTELVVVMPTYNEGSLLAHSVREWQIVLNGLGIPSTILIIDDASTDGSTTSLHQTVGCCAVRVVSQRHSGHCRAVFFGYQHAIADSTRKVDWVVQADADSEIPASAFPELWRRRDSADVVLGERDGRLSPPLRRALSATAARLVSWLWHNAAPPVRDVNVPLRLMRAEWLRNALDQLPLSPAAPNVLLVGVARQSGSSISTVPVPFTRRPGGRTALRHLFYVGSRCAPQLIALRLRGRPFTLTGPYLRELVLITPFPAEPELCPRSSFALAAYSQCLVEALRRVDPQLAVTILADVRHGHTELSSDGGVRIKRVWSPRAILSLARLWCSVVQASRPGTPVLIQFELAAFGGAAAGAALSTTLLMLRLSRRPATLVIHNMVLDRRAIRDHLGGRSAGPRSVFYLGLLGAWLRALRWLADSCIVLEGCLAERLRSHGYTGPITVIPHGVQITPGAEQRRFSTCSTEIRSSRVMIFGFPGWYKGTDWLIEGLSDDRVRRLFPASCDFVVAGSPNPVHMTTTRYRRYLANLERICAQANVHYISSVHSSQIKALFRAADLVVMPYRLMVGASGVLALAIEHGTPFAVSKPVEAWLESPDFREALERSGLQPSDLVFEDIADLASIVHRLASTDFERSVSQSLEYVRAMRSWEIVARRYRDALLHVPAHSER